MFTRVQMLCLPPVFYAKLDWFSYIRKKTRMSDIRNYYLISEIRAEFLISEIRTILWYQKIIFWYQKIIFWYHKISTNFWYAKKGTIFFISEIHVFSDIRNYFLISEIVFWYQKLRFSDIRKSFSDIRKSALESFLAFHTFLLLRFPHISQYMKDPSEIEIWAFWGV